MRTRTSATNTIWDALQTDAGTIKYHYISELWVPFRMEPRKSADGLYLTGEEGGRVQWEYQVKKNEGNGM